jgi:hypothetical protein
LESKFSTGKFESHSWKWRIDQLLHIHQVKGNVKQEQKDFKKIITLGMMKDLVKGSKNIVTCSSDYRRVSD